MLRASELRFVVPAALSATMAVVVAEGVCVGAEGDEGEAAAEGVVYEGDGAVCGVHGADEEDVVWNGEGGAVGEADFGRAVFKQVH